MMMLVIILNKKTMKKKYLFYVLVLTLLCSCSSHKYLTDTVWVNVTPVEKDGIKGNIVTSLYFWDKNKVTFYKAVEKDSIAIVKPVIAADGTYTCKGKLKKGAKITADVVNFDNTPLLYKGILTTDGMVLISPDSIIKGYSIISDLTIK
ncbi:hypothetical protein AGMMS50239_18990 [Bacteroidia bacterium]|nr:hypothetical protein AGMMS50239_18990 [Bacteroidia bacterium]